MKENIRIGIFDSGIGGLTVLKEIRKQLPKEDIIYYGEFVNLKYDTISQNEIIEIAKNIMSFMEKNRCKVVVVACCVFSAAALDFFKDNYNIPIIEVIDPGVRAALKQSKNNKIGLIGNPFTVNSNIYEKTLNKYSKNTNLYQVSSKALCDRIEAGWENTTANQNLLKKYLDKLPKDIDTLILGGTHYQLIRNHIKEKFSKNIVDSSEECVRDLSYFLTSNNLLNTKNEKGRIDFCINGKKRPFELSVSEIFKDETNYNIYSVD